MLRRCLPLLVLIALAHFATLHSRVFAAGASFKFFEYVTKNGSAMVTYTPSQLDPRQVANHGRLPTSSLRADLEALRPAFDGLVLYGYNESSTPRVLAVAQKLGFKSVLLGIWDLKSAAEVDGVARLANEYAGELAIGVLVGNEGTTFNRYEREDLEIAAARLKSQLAKDVPISTSEPLVGYKQDFIREFGDFLAPNIHPVFDRPQLAAAEAAAWAREQAETLSRQTGKPVLLKETGFPHAGKPQFTPESQAAFWGAYLKDGALARVAGKPGAWVFHGVAFEAFDLPWKSEESKLEIEKSWGFFSPDRKPYPAFDLWAKHAKSAR